MILFDVDMPKSCKECLLCMYHHGEPNDWKTGHFCIISSENVAYAMQHNERDSRCPLKEQKHGKWIVEADGMVTRCSECQSTITGLIFAKRWRYCHHCGAKMEVDDDRQ